MADNQATEEKKAQAEVEAEKKEAVVPKNDEAAAAAATGEGKKKKKKKKKKPAGEGNTESSSSALVLKSTAGEELAQQLIKARTKANHAFWDSQPVPKIDENTDGVNNYIHPPIPKEELNHTPYPLLSEFEWDECDLSNSTVLDEVYTLLNQNYVEDDDNMFRFDYSKDFLLWALKPPGWRKEWHLGVRVKASKKLVGFITAIPATLKVYDKEVKLVEINFLCVHKKLRTKRLAPLLIKEITRRVHVTNRFQAVYTAGVVLPRPVASCRYYHRSLHPKKLIDVGFSHLKSNMTMARTIKLYKLPEETKANLREMKKADTAKVHKLLTNYLKNYDMAPIFTQEEVEHWFVPRKDVISTYVVEDPKTKDITDMVSFYTLPSTILGNKDYNILKAAYSYYNVATQHDFVSLMNDALILAKKNDYDVFNALDILENDKIFKELKFGVGDGHLQYYLYNWKCPAMAPGRLGLVLL